MTALLELQRVMRRALQAPAEASAVPESSAALAEYVVGGPEAVAAALEIYRGTCIGVLLNALRLTYPVCGRLVGEEFFEGAARIFVDGAWPDVADLNAYGDGFADFLQGFAPAAGVPYLSDVARLEWAVSRALHANDMPAVTATHLAGMEPDALAQLRLAPQPSFSCLRLNYPADAVWRAVLAQDEAAMAVALEGGPVHVLVERRAAGVEVTRMSEDAWRLASALAASQALGQAVEAQDPRDIEQWLGEHLAAGRFYDASLAAACARRTELNEPNSMA
jgi:hypothetical protein